MPLSIAALRALWRIPRRVKVGLLVAMIVSLAIATGPLLRDPLLLGLIMTLAVSVALVIVAAPERRALPSRPVPPAP